MCWDNLGRGNPARFLFMPMTPNERRELDTALAADGLRLRGNSIVQEFTEGPLMLPCEPVVLVQDIEASVTDLEDADIPY